jgi:hypothetical protein
MVGVETETVGKVNVEVMTEVIIIILRTRLGLEKTF